MLIPTLIVASQMMKQESLSTTKTSGTAVRNRITALLQQQQESQAKVAFYQLQHCFADARFCHAHVQLIPDIRAILLLAACTQAVAARTTVRPLVSRGGAVAAAVAKTEGKAPGLARFKAGAVAAAFMAQIGGGGGAPAGGAAPAVGGGGGGFAAVVGAATAMSHGGGVGEARACLARIHDYFVLIRWLNTGLLVMIAFVAARPMTGAGSLELVITETGQRVWKRKEPKPEVTDSTPSPSAQPIASAVTA
jgi:hypothetical protein